MVPVGTLLTTNLAGLAHQSTVAESVAYRRLSLCSPRGFALATPAKPAWKERAGPVFWPGARHIP